MRAGSSPVAPVTSLRSASLWGAKIGVPPANHGFRGARTGFRHPHPFEVRPGPSTSFGRAAALLVWEPGRGLTADLKSLDRGTDQRCLAPRTLSGPARGTNIPGTWAHDP